jgi:putative serine protease PepD
VVSILGESATVSGSGSGFIVRPNGYIITNNHVIDLVKDGGTLTVVLNDGSSYPGTVVGGNPSYDIAVVKIKASNLPTVNLGDSSKVRVGDSAIAIGAPLGLEGTVTAGIVSALNRVVTPGEGTAEETSFINAIQTDAAISPGNSGGPLLDSGGSVIGVNAAMQSPVVGQDGAAANVGLGFAIPINSAKRIAEELISTGKSRTTLMGVGLDRAYDGAGARILTVTAGGPAAQAGLAKGDVITDVNGRSIDDDTELVVEIRNHPPGEKVVIDYTRDGQDRTANVVLGDDSNG